MIKQLLASTALVAALAATPALATHNGLEGDPEVPGKSEHAPGQQAKESDDLSAKDFAPGQQVKDGLADTAKDAAPGQHDAGENGETGNNDSE